MRRNRKYDVAGLAEAQFEPGSGKQVLKNLLGVKKGSEMERLETIALQQAEEVFVRKYGAKHHFSADDLCWMHKLWLGKIYSWAGTYRNVNLGKGGLQFASAQHIPQLMQGFERDYLAKHTPCIFKEQADIVRAIAEVHVEFILIHPFREGNGRLGRLLATLMALQAGLPPLDFSIVKGRKKQEYFAAVKEGLKKNYVPMKVVFQKVLEITLQRGQDK